MRRTIVRAFLAIAVMALAVTLSLSPAAGLQRALADDAPDNAIEVPGDSRPKDDEPATPRAGGRSLVGGPTGGTARC